MVPVELVTRSRENRINAAHRSTIPSLIVSSSGDIPHFLNALSASVLQYYSRGSLAPCAENPCGCALALVRSQCLLHSHRSDHTSLNLSIHRYYRCHGVTKTVTGPSTCDANSLRADELADAVWEKIVERLQGTRIVTLGMQDLVDLGQGLSEEIRDLEQTIAALIAREQELIKVMSVEGI